MRVRVALLLLVVSASVFARDIPSPAAPGGVHPYLAVDPDGRLMMMWTEAAGDGHAIKLATLRGDRWTEPQTIVERNDLFVNWADFPSVTVTDDGTLFAHWLQKSSAGKYSYDVQLARSHDGGKTWTKPAPVHRDGTPTEHGFVSIVPVRRDAIGVFWLDGREMKAEAHGEGHGEMTLRYARVDSKGAMAREDLLDARVCECCTTGATATPRGPLVVYRDRSAGEIRDISVVRWSRDGWTKPSPVSRDGWKIEGCPVNGPQIDAHETSAAVAWFTAADEKPRVNVAFTSDFGATFGAPIRIDSGTPTGRVDLIMLDSQRALVTWVDGLGDDAFIAMRVVARDGTMSPVEKIAVSSAARGSGFPRMAIAGDEVFVAWTEPSTPRRVRLVALRVPTL